MLGKEFGGAERSFVDLCGALARCGHSVLAVCETRAQVRHHIEALTGVSCATVSVHGPWDFFARRAIRRLLASYDADLAQTHLARAATIAGPAIRQLNLPSLAKTHNYVDLKYYRAIDHLVATTKKQHSYLLARGVTAERLSIIPNFSSLRADTPIRAGTSGAAPARRVLAVGRMVHKKGFDVLLEALALTRSRGCPLTLSIAGAGPECDALHEQRNALGLDSSVTFLGWQERVGESFAAADIFVLPSRDEPFGIVCLEAMAHGVPIIATMTDGPLEFLDDTCARLIPRDDPEALAQALMDTTTHVDEARRRATNARGRFDEYFSEAVVVRQYLELYEALLTAKTRSH
jgi:glycosyltransferase involved in cell wall biosynthesis